MMRQSHYRQPPSWSLEDRRSFRDLSQDVLAWCVLTDLDEPRQAAALRLSLRGSAQTFVRQLPAQALLQGGQIAGVQVTPITYLMYHLAARYAPLGEEIRLSAMTDLFTFARQRNETIDETLVRFDSTVQEASGTGQVTMSTQGTSWHLLKACGVSDN